MTLDDDDEGKFCRGKRRTLEIERSIRRKSLGGGADRVGQKRERTLLSPTPPFSPFLDDFALPVSRRRTRISQVGSWKLFSVAETTLLRFARATFRP